MTKKEFAALSKQIEGDQFVGAWTAVHVLDFPEANEILIWFKHSDGSTPNNDITAAGLGAAVIGRYFPHVPVDKRCDYVVPDQYDEHHQAVIRLPSP